jgi:two-component system LytT family response regulator
MKAIIVDDELDGIRTLQKILERYCPQVKVVTTCSSATIAKGQISAVHPDGVFLDIQMPSKTGLEMLTELPEILKLYLLLPITNTCFRHCSSVPQIIF